LGSQKFSFGEPFGEQNKPPVSCLLFSAVLLSFEARNGGVASFLPLLSFGEQKERGLLLPPGRGLLLPKAKG
jgi:hypothetical protein